MIIQEIKTFSPEIEKSINRFLILLVENANSISKQLIESIISDKNSHIFFAVTDDGEYSGMVTVGIYISPTGKKAWIEDVVVDEKYRRQGVGQYLTESAIQFARNQQADIVMLTSKPCRISANKLYQKIGFQLKQTNVYRMTLK